MREVYIFGHKKPDTDSVTSSIALAYLKNKLGMLSKPMILSKINKETEFVLNYFNTPIPEILEDVKLQIKDLNYYNNCYVYEDDSIMKTYNYMQENNITGIPIVDSQKKFKGLLTSKMIGNELINGCFTELSTSYKNIVDVLNGSEVFKFDDEITGNIIVAAFKSTTFLNSLELNSKTIMIVGDRHSLIEAAINAKIKLIIIVGNLDIKEEHLILAEQNKINIIKTEYDTFHVAKLIGLSNCVKNLLMDSRNVSFTEDDYYDEFKEKCSRLGYNNYPVIDNSNNCLGLIRITDINKKNKKQVILVDHNESTQSVDGLNEAEILEIIDHHKIGNLTTNMPINFRNTTVGSTNTIIYSIFNENNICIPSDIAGIMLSGIISDTLKFTSPTTTEQDKEVALKLASISNIDIKEYSNKMFKSGTNLSGKTLDEIIEQDMKIFEFNNKKIVISQLITLNAEEILDQKRKYVEKLNEIKNNNKYDLILLCVTDIIKDGSYIFYDEGSSELIKLAFNDENKYEGFFFPKCLSRKKQLVPLIMNILSK